jgi:hypothetical protein
MDNQIVKKWNIFLSSISIFNMFIILLFFIFNRNNFDRTMTVMFICVSIFAIVCGIRSIWPRSDGQKLCLYKNKISTPIVGRTLATIAEMAFAFLIVLVTTIILFDIKKMKLGNSNTINSILNYNWIIILLIAIAQICCWIGVITSNPIWNALEESIWTLFGSSKLIIYSYILYILLNSKRTPKSNHLIKFIPFMMIFMVSYIWFMVTVDVPMYISRYYNSDGKYVNFFKGIKELSNCKVVSSSFSHWKQEIPWLTLYFTIAVWISMSTLPWYNHYRTL